MGILCNGYSLVGVERDLRSFGYIARVQTPGGEYINIAFHEEIYTLPERDFLIFIKDSAEHYYEQHQKEKKGGMCVVPENWESMVRTTRRLTQSLDDMWVRHFMGRDTTTATVSGFTGTETAAYRWRGDNNPWIV